MTDQLTELQMNQTLALRAEQALEPVRELAAQLSETSAEASHLHERLSAGASLRAYDFYLAISMVAQAVYDIRERLEELEK